MSPLSHRSMTLPEPFVRPPVTAAGRAQRIALAALATSPRACRVVFEGKGRQA